MMQLNCLIFLFFGLINSFESHQINYKLLPALHHIYGNNHEDFDIVSPIITGEQKRNADEFPSHINYSFTAFGNSFHLNLEKSFSPSDIKTVYYHENNTVTFQTTKSKNCFYRGSLTSDKSFLALSTCHGLSGFIRTSQKDFVIHPLSTHQRINNNFQSINGITHIIYKKRASEETFCGVGKAKQNTLTKKIRGTNAHGAKRLTVETALFVDTAMNDYFVVTYSENADEFLKEYVMNIMNGVEIFYNHKSLSEKEFKFPVLSIHVFKKPHSKVTVTQDADRYMYRFCEWQNTINPSDDSDPDHWDLGILLTGVDIRTGRNYGTIGNAPVSGMCNPKRSCALIEGKFFESVMTTTHEIGHTFGMYHDGDGNDCDLTQYIMSYKAGPGQATWSSCSGASMLEDLRYSRSVCLLDENEGKKSKSKTLPGQLYDVTTQCKMALGQEAVRYLRQPLEDICNILKCIDSSSVIKEIHPALQGTFCGKDSWCQYGVCTPWHENGPAPVNGEWGQWENDGICRSSCLIHGVGILMSTRKCDNPKPLNGGKMCSGLPYQSEICDDSLICTKKMSNNEYANQQCGKAPLATRIHIKPKGYQIFDDESEGCTIWCQTESGQPQHTSWGERFPDGTDCSEGEGRAYCINGVCQRISS